MSLILTLHTPPEVPLELEGLNPDTLAGVGGDALDRIPVLHGNESNCLADFFRARGSCNGEIHLEGDLSMVKHLGAGMRNGFIHVHGNVGAHLGAGMCGGRILVDGDAGDWVAPEMRGGCIHIRGNAGHLAGSAYRGSPVGMTDGEIVVEGNVRNELGHGMRGGLIAVAGDSGDFTGVNMLAGTIVVLGHLGIRSGAGMKRGTIVSMHEAEILPTFGRACVYAPVFLRLYLRRLRSAGLEMCDDYLEGEYIRWSGDAVELSRGEILIYEKT